MKTKKNIILIVSLLIITFTFQGCAAAMAASGTREANLSALNKGDTRSMVLAKVGQQPSRVINDEKGIMEIYELERGNEPSAGRAIAHGVLTISTLGLWELLGTPLEVAKGEKYYLTVYYDINEELKKFEITTTRLN